jgi:tripeptide aminopeptidase
MIDTNRLINLFLELVAIDSESGDEREICDFLKQYLSQFTKDIQEDNAGASFGGNAGNIIARIKGNAPAPRILLNAHMDVIAPAKGVKPVRDGDIIRSDGSTTLGADDKAGIACILEALNAIRGHSLPHGDLLVIFTVSEEIHLKGAHALDPKHLDADFGFTLDSTGVAGDIITSSPSHDTIAARVFGRAAHAGMEPEKGTNAIWVASRAIARMKLGRIDSETTANIGIIKGGRATNIVPDQVEVTGEARSRNLEKLDAQIAHMKECLETTAAQLGATVKVGVQREYMAYKHSEQIPVIQHAVAAAASLGLEPHFISSGGGSDANVFNERGLPTAPMGAAMQNPHRLDEFLNVNDLAGAARFTLALVHAK